MPWPKKPPPDWPRPWLHLVAPKANASATLHAGIVKWTKCLLDVIVMRMATAVTFAACARWTKLSQRVVPDHPEDLLLLRSARVATAIARTGSLQRRTGLRPNFSVNAESLRLLKSAHRCFSARTEYSVEAIWVEP
jgi:hypothetical protein